MVATPKSPPPNVAATDPDAFDPTAFDPTVESNAAPAVLDPATPPSQLPSHRPVNIGIVDRTNPDALKLRVAPLSVTWEPLPPDYILDNTPVDNTGQPLIAGALRESLEISGLIRPEMLIATNFGLCATVNEELVIKAPDWVYVARVAEILSDRRSYSPTLQGDVPTLVMEFLSETPGDEYSEDPVVPLGKWFFYEQILQIPIYIIFEPDSGLLALYRRINGRYTLEMPDENGQHWLPELNLFLGTWRGAKADRTGYWLRWWNAAGERLPWAVEQIAQETQRAAQATQRAEQEAQRAEQEAQRAEQERQRAERLAAMLRSQGIDPNQL